MELNAYLKVGDIKVSVCFLEHNSSDNITFYNLDVVDELSRTFHNSDEYDVNFPALLCIFNKEFPVEVSFQRNRTSLWPIFGKVSVSNACKIVRGLGLKGTISKALLRTIFE